VETSAFRPVDVVVALRTGLPIHGRFSSREAGNALCLGVPRYADSHEGRGNAVSDLAKRRLIDVAVTAVFVFTLTLLTEKWWMPPALLAHAMWNFYDGMTRRDLQA
jgi:hypothetical protein